MPDRKGSQKGLPGKVREQTPPQQVHREAPGSKTEQQDKVDLDARPEKGKKPNPPKRKTPKH